MYIYIYITDGFDHIKIATLETNCNNNEVKIKQ
jgi:hypothetical protein